MLYFVNCLAFAQMSKIHVFHINGINVTRSETYANTEALRLNSKVDSNMVAWDFLYNQTHGLWDDLLDVFKQKTQEQRGKITLDDYVAAYLHHSDLDYLPGSTDYAIVKASIKDDYLNNPQFFGANFDDLLLQFHDKYSVE